LRSGTESGEPAAARHRAMKIRRACKSDLTAMVRIQHECYSGHLLESADAFAAKLSADPDLSFIALRREVPVAYVVAIPWVFGDVPALNGDDCAIPAKADGVYVHDLAASPAARNSGVAGNLLRCVTEAGKAKGYRQAFLVAIRGAASYWRRYGFEAVAVGDALQRRLSAYGEGARYMAKWIAAADRLPGADTVR
jgi:predicted N-acetyltransferase YhbS